MNLEHMVIGMALRLLRQLGHSDLFCIERLMQTSQYNFEQYGHIVAFLTLS
jgi:hypothetical protein